MHAILAEAAEAAKASDLSAWLVGGGLGAFSGTVIWCVRVGLPNFLAAVVVQVNKVLDDHKEQLAAERQWYERQLESNSKRSDAMIEKLSGTVDKIDVTVDKMGDALRAYNNRSQRRKPPQDEH